MTQNFDNLRHLCNVMHKPILVIKDLSESKTYYYMLDEYMSYNPGSHIYENYVNGKEISSIIGSVTSFATGFTQGNDDISIMQKIESLPSTKFYFPNSENFVYVRVLS